MPMNHATKNELCSVFLDCDDRHNCYAHHTHPYVNSTDMYALETQNILCMYYILYVLRNYSIVKLGSIA